jgi:DNA-binding NtrC family response regulator
MNENEPVFFQPGPKPAREQASPALLTSLSPAMRELDRAISDVARADLPVLLVGERGTGKEIVAREIHRRHAEAPAKFLKARCAELTPRLIDELFEEAGRVADAPATIFLDEIGELSPACQDALADAIASADGNGHARNEQARLISATNRNIEEEIRKQHFREELLYRLNGVCLRVPPLRHRREDIPAFLDFFLKRDAGELGIAPAEVQAKTIAVLLRHSWPGNVRELEEVARKILLSDERSALAGLDCFRTRVTDGAEEGATLPLKEAARNASRQVERELILKTLSRTRWNRKRAARELGISYKALLYKLKQIAIDDPREI